jgi:hypothetical protein
MVRLSRRQGFQLMLGASQVALLGAGPAAAFATYVARVIGFAPDWYLPLGGPTAAALVSANGTYINNPQLDAVMGLSRSVSVGWLSLRVMM